MLWLIFAGLIVGILAADLFPSSNLWVAAILVCFCLMTASFRRYKLTLVLLVVALGFILTVLRLDLLYDARELYGDVSRYCIQSQRVLFSGEDYVAWQGQVLEPETLAGAKVVIYTEDFSPGLYYLSGKLMPPVQFRNPGQGWHYKRKIYTGEIGTILYPFIYNHQPVRRGWLESVRDGYRANIATIPGENAAGLALALTTGDRSLLSRDMRFSIYDVGIGHIIALSGLHVSVLTSIVLTMLRGIGFKRSAGIIAAAFLVLFVAFVGPSPSLIRAVLMSVMGMAAVFLDRQSQGLSALAWTGLFMLLFNPLWLFDYAFVFSFLATFTCLIAGSKLEAYLEFLPRLIKKTASLTIVIQLAALPLNFLLFGGFSLWALFVNMVIIPLLPLMAAASFMAGIFSGFISFVNLPASALLEGFSVLIQILSQLPVRLELGGIKQAWAAVAAVVLLLLLMGLSKRVVAIALVITVVALTGYSILEMQTCAIWFLDVGQGDAILIRDGGKWILIDCGDSFAGSVGVVPALKFLGADKLTVIISHPHHDHSGGLAAVLENFTVTTVLVNQCFSDSEYAELAPQAEIVFAGRQIGNLNVLYHNRKFANLNDNSLLVTLKWRGVGVLFTGDIEAEGERAYLGMLDQYDILKVAHHGSNTSSSPEFISHTKPSYAVISCGLGNRYGMPSPNVLDNFDAKDVTVFRTDQAGYIRAMVWPWNKISIHSFRGR